ncbi:MAG: putative quinone binding protein, partial [uncultured Thermomicrobiales bacterium]
ERFRKPAGWRPDAAPIDAFPSNRVAAVATSVCRLARSCVLARPVRRGVPRGGRPPTDHAARRHPAGPGGGDRPAHARARHRRPARRRSRRLARLLPPPRTRHPDRRRPRRRGVPAPPAHRAGLLLGDDRVHPPGLPGLRAGHRRPEGLARVWLPDPGGGRRDVRRPRRRGPRQLQGAALVGLHPLRGRRRSRRQPDQPTLPAGPV